VRQFEVEAELWFHGHGISFAFAVGLTEICVLLGQAWEVARILVRVVYLFIYFASPGSYVYKKTLKTITKPGRDTTTVRITVGPN